MKIGKYEFDSKEESLQIIGGLDKEINIVHLGFLLTQQGTYDEDGNELTPPIFSNKYSVDVLWENEEHPLFTPYFIEVVGNGSHGFAGLDYQNFKVR